MQRKLMAYALSLALTPLTVMATPAPDTATLQLDMQLDDGALSVTIDSQSVANIVTALNRLTPGGCAIGGYVFDTQATVSVTFQELPLRTGLRRLLKGTDYLLDCERDRTPGIRLELLTGAHEITRPANSAMSQTTAAQEYSVTPSAVTDIAATTARLHDLYERGDIDDLSVELEIAIVHEDIAVREQALELLVQLDHPAAVELVERVAVTEVDPQLRVQAMETIAARGGSRAVALLEMAAAEHASDQPLVATQALELLAQLGTEEHSGE